MSGSILFLPAYTQGKEKHLVCAGIKPKSSCFSSGRHLTMTIRDAFYFDQVSLHISPIYLRISNLSLFPGSQKVPEGASHALAPLQAVPIPAHRNSFFSQGKGPKVKGQAGKIMKI